MKYLPFILAALLLAAAGVAAQSFPDSQVKQCVISHIGEARFFELSQGALLTPEEEAVFQQCLAQAGESLTLPPPSTSPAPPSATEETGVISMTPELEACLRNAMGEARFEAISSGRSQPTEEEQQKGSRCFGGTVVLPPGVHPGTLPPAQPPPFPPAVMQCLREGVGETRFNAINSGSSSPTDREMQIGMRCFEQHGVKPPVVDPAQDMPPQVVQCLKLAVGEQRFNEISQGRSMPTLAERKAGEKCFGAQPGAIAPPVKVKMPAELEACLKQAVGEERFIIVSSGQDVPTPEEHAKGDRCFVKAKGAAAPAPEIMLPPPPEQVPYLPEEPEEVVIEEIILEETPNEEGENETTGFVPPARAANAKGKKSVVLEGKARPGAIVDIYVFSEPITAATEASEDGQWSYRLERDNLPEGGHLAYAVVGDVRSPAKSFVAEARAAETTPQRIGTAPISKEAGRTALFALLGIGVLVLIGGLYYTLKKKNA